MVKVEIKNTKNLFSTTVKHYTFQFNEPSQGITVSYEIMFTKYEEELKS